MIFGVGAYPTFSADIQDSFVQDLNLMQDTFGEDATRANSLKKQIQYTNSPL